jgi:hypothetical protein
MIHVRQVTSALAIRDGGDGRTLHGPVLPWGIEARVVDAGRLVTETFERGALAGTDPGRVPFTATHPRDAGTLPIGVTVELEERDDAAWGAWRVSKTALGDEVLELARDGVPSASRSGSPKYPAGPAGQPTGAGWSGPGPSWTMSPWSGSPPTRAPGSPGCGRPPPEPRTWPYCSPCYGAMGKALTTLFRGQPQGRCVACKTHFIGPGQRCQPCQQKLRDRKRRKPR